MSLDEYQQAAARTRLRTGMSLQQLASKIQSSSRRDTLESLTRSAGMDSDESLKPIREELFDPKSPEYHASLNTLRDHLLRIGYRVPRKRARETTLRVYLDDGIDYPLLNPVLRTVPLNVD